MDDKPQAPEGQAKVMSPARLGLKGYVQMLGP